MISKFSKLVQTIKKHGIGYAIIGLIILTMLFSVITIFTYFNKNMDRLQSLTKRDRFSLNIVADYNLQMNQMLKFLAIKHQFDRAYVMEFHNGQDNMLGLPFFFQSCRFEYVANTTTAQMMNMQKVPISINID